MFIEIIVWYLSIKSNDKDLIFKIFFYIFHLKFVIYWKQWKIGIAEIILLHLKFFLVGSKTGYILLDRVKTF